MTRSGWIDPKITVPKHSKRYLVRIKVTGSRCFLVVGGTYIGATLWCLDLKPPKQDHAVVAYMNIPT